VASWRHPGGQFDAGINFKHYVEIFQVKGPLNNSASAAGTSSDRAWPSRL
jgi:hypothetical protein